MSSILIYSITLSGTEIRLVCFPGSTLGGSRRHALALRSIMRPATPTARQRGWAGEKCRRATLCRVTISFLEFHCSEAHIVAVIVCVVQNPHLTNDSRDAQILALPPPCKLIWCLPLESMVIVLVTTGIMSNTIRPRRRRVCAYQNAGSEDACRTPPKGGKSP